MTLRRPPGDTPGLYGQEGKGDEALVYAHYFVAGMDWWVTEYDTEQDIAFGWVSLGDPQNAEWGYFVIGELETARAGGIYPVDFELDWRPVTLAEAKALQARRRGEVSS